jgi:hypothetical protein
MTEDVHTVEQFNDLAPTLSWDWFNFFETGRLVIADREGKRYSIKQHIWDHPHALIRSSAKNSWDIWRSQQRKK